MTTPTITSHSHYDLIILGGGSAGIVAGVMAGSLGLRVLLIEKNRMGGECLNTGCVPSKALLHAARVAHTLRTTAADLGLPTIPLTREQTAPVLQKVRDTIKTTRDADDTTKLLEDSGVEVRFGEPSFTNPKTLTVKTADGETQITANHFLIATGSRPAVPTVISGITETPYLTNQTVFDLAEIPGTLLIIGGGPIGVEMAQAFQRLGSQVVLVQQGERLLPRDDAELVGLLTEQLGKEGVAIYTATTLERIDGNTATLRKQGRDEPATVPFDRILIAAGRTPNIEGLKLENAGVDVGEHGIMTDSHLRTTAPHIYACGDVSSAGYQFSHVAEYQAKTAVRNIVFPGESRADYAAMPWTTFTEPELAHLGLTEDEARKQGVAYDVYRQPFAQNDRAITDGADRMPGVVKVLVEPGIGGRVLGVQILGPGAGELLQEWVLVMNERGSIRTIADLVHVYPTFSMASQHAAQRWYEAQAKVPVVKGALNTYITAIRPNQNVIATAAVGLGILGTAAILSQKKGAKQENG